MKVNYVLLYGTPYLKHKVFGTFEDISKFLINKNIVNYSIFKKLEDEEEVEMIYRDNDIRVLEDRIDKAIEYIRNNCISSNEWTDLDFCNFVPTGNIKYKQLTSKKVKDLLDILRGEDNV